MKNGLTLFLGVFLTLALSWAGVLLSAHRQYSGLAQFKDPAEESLHPSPLVGLADQGRAVYQDLGCVACHTQQVRREDFGGDVARQWGTRQSVARDYIRERTVFLGHNRIGPDLRNVGRRLGDPTPENAAQYDEWLYKLLYAPETVAPGTNMPAYPFLFEERPLSAGQPSPLALNLRGKHAPPAGHEIVPTQRAKALVAYLRSLNDSYEFPEAKHFVPEKKKGGGH